MPIHLIWGDDSAASERAIDLLITEIIDPTWLSINLSRLDGADLPQASKALEEVRTPPFGNGGRVVLVKRSPFCNGCPNELVAIFEDVLELIPEQTHLILTHPNKPDGRLKTTKALQRLIASNQATERKFVLPPIWDGAGQRALVERMAKELGLKLERDATSNLIDAIGNDSERLNSELQKLALHAQINQKNSQQGSSNILITAESVSELIQGISTNVFQIGDALLQNDIGNAISRLDALLNQGEPALRLLATLIGQVRGWLWVSLLEQEGEQDVNFIAKSAGIGNPKRIYVIRKQIKGISTNHFLSLLSRLLAVEGALKQGIPPKYAFRDGLLTNHFVE